VEQVNEQTAVIITMSALTPDSAFDLFRAMRGHLTLGYMVVPFFRESIVHPSGAHLAASRFSFSHFCVERFWDHTFGKSTLQEKNGKERRRAKKKAMIDPDMLQVTPDSGKMGHLYCERTCIL
jgi:hypothetical protein